MRRSSVQTGSHGWRRAQRVGRSELNCVVERAVLGTTHRIDSVQALDAPSIKEKVFHQENTADARSLFMANLLWGSLPIEGQHLQLPLNRN
jgi:hypothetical protein